MAAGSSEEWRVKKFKALTVESDLAEWLNGIENEPETDFFFLDQLVVLREGVVLAVANITKRVANDGLEK